MKLILERTKLHLNRMDWLAPLISRISIGVVFAESGWGKLQNLSQVTDYFISLGIPWAHGQAPLVASLEFVGGLLLIVGLFTRITSIPLIGIMTVAIITAKKEEIGSFTDLFGFSEFLYIVLLLWLLITGPGKLSIDHFILKKVKD